jgi:CBS domain-containing protein
MQTLKHVTARELMRSPVITLPTDASIAEALSVFEDEGISGVPVIDAAGAVVGMLTQHDVARGEHLRKDRLQTGREWSFGESAGETLEEQEREILAREDYSPEMLGRDTVGDWMSPKVLAVPTNASLRQVCDLMRRESIHRVLVVERTRPAGIITSSDIVRFLADNL